MQIRSVFSISVFSISLFSISTLVLSLAIPAQANAEIKSSELTSVRIVERPDIKMITGKGQATLAVSAVVRNVGDTTANGVRAFAKLPTGDSLTLSGPAVLERNQKATYSGQQQKVLVNPSKVRLDATCDNCH